MNTFNKDLRLQDIIEEAKKAKAQNISLNTVFSKMSAKYGLKKGTVRNIYYKALKSNAVSGLTAIKPVKFSAEEEKELLKKIMLKTTKGKSVRGAINELTSDTKLSLRYLNKYRNMLKNDEQTVASIRLEIEKSLGSCVNPYQKKTAEEDALEKLKREINSLYDRICEHTKKENEELRARISYYAEENLRLKALLQSDGNSAVKDYFESVNRR